MRILILCLASVMMLAAPSCAQSYWYSFENSMDGWAADAADAMPGPNWYINPSLDRATAGQWSLIMHMDNYNDATKIWIEKSFIVPPGRVYDVSLRWSFASRDWGMANLFNIIASVGGKDPESMADFVTIGHTGNGASSDIGYKWMTKTYTKQVTPASVDGLGSGVIWIGLGVWGTWETPRTYYLDNLYVDISPAVAYQTTTIAGARAFPDGTNVTISNVGASSASNELAGRMYAEHADRRAGIAVETTPNPPPIARNMLLTLKGTLGTEGGERILNNALISAPVAAGPIPIYPIFLTNRDFGGSTFGSYAPGIEGAIGLNNVGLLVTVCGRVVDSGVGWFAISDGSRAASCGKSATPGLAVGYPLWMGNPPPTGWYVMVTGPSGAFESGGTVYPILRPRSQTDLLVLSQ
ncbi:MAG: hypothetical protein KBC96_12360 [Armatimonadetes bacterium]|nr:hypothetical protein [Armatimonadota bacterium]